MRVALYATFAGGCNGAGLRECDRATITPFLTGTSAAQNGPVIQICPKCGALLLEEADKSSFCDTILVAEDHAHPHASAGESSPPPQRANGHSDSTGGE